MWRATLLLRLRWAISGLLAAIIVAGLTFYAVQRRGLAQETATARTDIQLRAALIASEMARFRLLPMALVDDRDVVAAVNGDARARAALSRKLEGLVAVTGARTIYVVGKDGKAIAASNWRSPQSFVGSDYSTRRYVRDALANGGASHFAMGSVSRRPGLYVARRTAAGGVVVIKLEFDRIEAAWTRAEGITFVSDRNGIVLVSSRPEWRFFLTRPIPDTVFDTFLAQAMLPAQTSHRVPVRFSGERALVDGRAMIAVGTPLPQPGWHITLLRPIGATVTFARVAAALAGVLILGLAMIGWMRHERGIERARRTKELERAVADSTADLRREMDERAASEARAADLREGLRQANRLATLGQITASVAHETAQPVAAIRAYADTSRALLDRGDVATVETNLAAIARLADRIGSVTSELRGFSRRVTHDVAPVAVGAVIEGALLILKEQLKHIQLIMPAHGSAVLVGGGKVKLEQVLVNLLQNAAEALKATHEPTIQLQLREMQDEVVLAVMDNGPGISGELQERLFTPFVTSRPEGLGLGLVISQDIMTDAGGGLRLVSPHNSAGAIFEMTMRRA